MRTTINLAVATGAQVFVDADVFGQWAAHVSPDRYVHADKRPVRRANVVTHVPTGLFVPMSELCGLSKLRAMSAASYLGKTVTATPEECEAIIADAKAGTLSDPSRAFAQRVMDEVRAWANRKPGGTP